MRVGWDKILRIGCIQSNDNELNNIKFFLLEKRGSVKPLIDLPHFAQSPDFHAANDCNCDETSHHYRGLKHVCPHHSFQSTLITNHINSFISECIVIIVSGPLQ